MHYENPKPTATLVCPRKEEILLVKRAVGPGKNMWGLQCGFVERGESLGAAARRELKEETMLDGGDIKIIGTCSYFNIMFGDKLLIGLDV